MAKIIYACYRKTVINPEIKKRIYASCEELNPDNISALKPKIFSSNKIIYGISNPSKPLETESENVLLGKLFKKGESWNEIGKNSFNGNYVIFRTNQNIVEVVTDCLGTRSVWYYLDKDVFIASTSQKAIIKFLGSFEFDERVIPWVISNGTLGPSYCWDKRLKMVPSDGTVILDRKEWTIKTKSIPVKFSPLDISDKELEALLKKSILETFKNIDLDFKKWIITLSGGHDSRAILLLFQKVKNTPKKFFRTITWGVKKSIQDKESDAGVAKRISEEVGTKHQYYPTELSDEPIEKIVDRFLNNGEGRLDHITGYLDGFKIWQKIYEQGFTGVIRGDEVFGYNKIFSPLIVNNFMGLTLCSEYSNLKKYAYLNSLYQEVPGHLKQNENESISTWRDRIFQLYRIPYIQSSLADLKYSYVEQINPFLSKEIVTLLRQVPDNLRTDKKLFKRIMKSFDLGIPYSKRDSNLKLENVLKQKKFVHLIKKELTTEYARTIFPQNFLNQIIMNLKIEEKNKKINPSDIIKKLIPKRVKILLSQKNKKLSLDNNILCFRVFIICKMHRNLSALQLKKN